MTKVCDTSSKIVLCSGCSTSSMFSEVLCVLGMLQYVVTINLVLFMVIMFCVLQFLCQLPFKLRMTKIQALLWVFYKFCMTVFSEVLCMYLYM